MDSFVEFTLGVAKRIYWILPALVLDPFDLAERFFKVNYEVPQPLSWILFGIGLFIASYLTHHALSKNTSFGENEVRLIGGAPDHNNQISPEVIQQEEVLYQRLRSEHQRKYNVDPPETWLILESKRLARGAASWWEIGLAQKLPHRKLLAEYSMAITRTQLLHCGFSDVDGLMIIFSRGDSPMIEGPCSNCGISRHQQSSACWAKYIME